AQLFHTGAGSWYAFSCVSEADETLSKNPD
ncbi:unnamed protein product, partial [marine sediment metagenome]